MGISLQQFKQMSERVRGRTGHAAATPVLEPTRRRASAEIILGIDPSLRGTGYGVIRAGKSQSVALTHGTIACPAGWPQSRCLAHISQTVRELLTKHQPQACAVEGLFYAQNLRTAIVLGEARGAVLAAVAEAGLEVYELAPRKVKQAIVGYGAAQKLAVAKMVQRMLQLPEPPAPDAADALALALAFAHEQNGYRLTTPKRI